MKVVRFESVEENSPYYTCSQIGNMSGPYQKWEDYHELNNKYRQLRRLLEQVDGIGAYLYDINARYRDATKSDELTQLLSDIREALK